jgi:hypothetical protein
MMIHRRTTLKVAVVAMGMACLVLLATLALAQPAWAMAPLYAQEGSAVSTAGDLGPRQEGPVVFPQDDWPWYAQEEISVHPEPPIPGHLTELCATVINLDPVEAHPATLLFGIAEFGIGMPFDPVGQAEVVVPPGGEATSCVVWVPPEPGPWCVEVVLRQPNVPEDQRSLRNLDLDEPLVAGEPHTRSFQVGNPLQRVVDIQLGLIPHLDGWGLELSADFLREMAPGEVREVSLTVTPPAALPPGLTPIVDVEAYVDGVLIGGFRKIFRPPLLLHRFPDPPYAEREISVHPYPILVGEPAEICVELRNPTAIPQDVNVQFSWAGFGIGIPFTPINGLRPVHLPPYSVVNECIHWIPPVSGHVCLQVELLMEGYEPQRSQRNIDVNEPLVPGEPHTLRFPVGNPLERVVTIQLGLIPHLDGWGLELVPDVLPEMQLGEERYVELTVTPPAGVPLPPDGHPIVDVEALVDGELIGGFRKVFRPPVPIHRPGEPTYGESELSIEPYPPRAGEPVAICTRIRNYADVAQTVQVEFGAAGFGIGIPFMPIAPVMTVELPPLSEREVCVNYVFSYGGQFCVQVRIQAEGYPEVLSQRNFDVIEVLQAGQPDHFEVPVGNPFSEPKTITLGLINHTGWEVKMSPEVIPDAPPWPEPPTPVSLWITPTGDVAELPEFAPVIDLEAYVDNRLIGGIRKVFRPPIQLHPFPDPPYAEREITVHPYPPLAGEPTEVCVELRNPTVFPQDVAVQFSWADFGIGIPFTPINGRRLVHLPPHSVVRECIHWIPPVSGHVCLQVELFMEGYAPQRSQRNIDVDEPLVPGEPHGLAFPVGNPLDHVATIELGLVPHLEGWRLGLVPDVLENMQPGEERLVELTVTPPQGVPLPEDGQPIVDVEAFVEGRLIGGFRKIHRPPIQLHPFPDPPYAEREITVHPYPPLAGEPTEICVELRNPTPFPQDVAVQFSWADFGIGIPFTPIDGRRPVHLPPQSVVKECIHWIPPVSGHLCLQVELFMDGYAPQRSQRNIDVDEPLVPGEPHTLRFPVGNPLGRQATIELGLIPHIDGWRLELAPDVLPDMIPGEVRYVELTVTPPRSVPLPNDGRPIVDVEAFAEGELIGGFRKIHRPPIQLHPFPDPPYAEREITVHPYPPRAGEPTEVCVELRNPTPFPQDVKVQFSWADFGIGIPFTPINGLRPVHLPPYSVVKECIHWIPPVSGHVCLQVELFMDGYATQRSQRNIDVNEPLVPGEPHGLRFPVGNPVGHQATIELGLVPHLEGWGLELVPNVLENMEPGEERLVELIVTPPQGVPLPEDGQPIVDVEAFVAGKLIGGFRKIYRPPVPIHRPKDPIYAESEIVIHPYPPRAHEPTELKAEIHNPTDEWQTVTVVFSSANFGIGLPFTPVHDPLIVAVPPGGRVWAGIIWVPPRGGLWCIQVEIQLPNIERTYYSQRNIDVGEPLEPNTPHARPFLVGNPTGQRATITLGLIPHFPDWGLELSQDVLPDMGPGDVREVILTVTPPNDLPADGDPIVDVEAFVDGKLIGGFRKIYRPPVPIHRPKDPIYAESEIGVDPYPVLPGQPTRLSVEVFNPTDEDRIVTAYFSIAPFGIGLPFSPDHITPNPIRIFVPRHGAARGHVIWEPPDWAGKFCVRVELEMEGHERIWSQRNIDVGEPLRRGQPHSLVFPVGIWPYSEPMTVTLGLINHRDGWEVSLSEDVLTNVQPGQPVDVTLTVSPTNDAILGTGEPIVDVEAYVEGELLGGFRKLDIPPMPIHKPHEKDYAETELSIEPDPPRLGEEAKVSVVLQNNGPTKTKATVEFGWAKFGMGIPFSTAGMDPYTRTVEADPGTTVTTWVTWTPVFSGPHCVMVKLIDPEGDYEDVISRRNVDVEDQPPCGETRTFTLTVYNDQPTAVTVEIGKILFDVPADWQISTEPSETLELEPLTEGTILVTVIIPCPTTRQAVLAQQELAALQQGAGGVPTIDVEGYVDGELVGGIELQFPPRWLYVYLPVILKNP